MLYCVSLILSVSGEGKAIALAATVALLGAWNLVIIRRSLHLTARKKLGLTIGLAVIVGLAAVHVGLRLL